MAFVRPLAIHNIQLPGPTYVAAARMAALYDQLWGPGGASDLWVASLPEEFQAPQTSEGAGDFSFLLKRVGQPNAPQFNFRNRAASQIDVPSLYPYLAINPDGGLDEIVDSVNVQNGSAATPANQNGILGQPTTYLAGYGFLNVWEFDDAICIISRSADGTIVGDMLLFGDIIEPEWAGDADGDGGANDLRIGLGVISGQPRSNTWSSSAFSSVPSGACARVSLGNADLSAVYDTSWLRGAASGFYQSWQTNRPRSVGWYPFGPDSVHRLSPVRADVYGGGPQLGEFKYLKMIPDTETFSRWQVAGIDYLLCLNFEAAVTGWIHIATTTSYDPIVLGKYT